MNIQISVSGYTLSLTCSKDGCGTLVRLPDQVEASFNSYEGLIHLLEGMLGRRRWDDHREQVLATCAALIDCA